METSYAQARGQVTSRGCSKGYMVCIFYRALEYAINCHESGATFGWPYPAAAITEWIKSARGDMRERPDWDRM